ATEVERDPVEPRRELGLAPKAWQRAERAEKRLLAHVSRVLFATDGAVREGVDGAFPSQDQLIETVGIAANRFRDELFVRPRHAERGRPLSEADFRLLSGTKTADRGGQSGRPPCAVIIPWRVLTDGRLRLYPPSSTAPTVGGLRSIA